VTPHAPLSGSTSCTRAARRSSPARWAASDRTCSCPVARRKVGALSVTLGADGAEAGLGPVCQRLVGVRAHRAAGCARSGRSAARAVLSSAGSRSSRSSSVSDRSGRWPVATTHLARPDRRVSAPTNSSRPAITRTPWTPNRSWSRTASVLTAWPPRSRAGRGREAGPRCPHRRPAAWSPDQPGHLSGWMLVPQGQWT
jgi:hypothetical protein